MFGYDVRNYVELRSPADLGRFRFDPFVDVGQYPSMTKVPWPDNTFDFVFATSVFEHVSDQTLAYSEVNRVLKPGGSFLNIFPSKWRPIETHINIPFGGVFTSRRYHQLCAALGIRGLGQEQCTAEEVVEINRRFITQGVNYLSGRQIADLFRRVFGEFEYVEDAFIRHGRGRSRHLAIPLKFLPLVRQLFRFAHTQLSWCASDVERDVPDRLCSSSRLGNFGLAQCRRLSRDAEPVRASGHAAVDDRQVTGVLFRAKAHERRKFSRCGSSIPTTTRSYSKRRATDALKRLPSSEMTASSAIPAADRDRHRYHAKHHREQHHGIGEGQHETLGASHGPNVDLHRMPL